MAYQMSGAVKMTTSGTIGPAGKSIRVWNAHWKAAGVPVPTLYLRSGSAATDTMWYEKSGIASDTRETSFGNGLLFPVGCYYNHSTLSSYAVIEYEVEL